MNNMETEEIFGQGESAITKTTQIIDEFEEEYLSQKVRKNKEHKKKKSKNKFYVTELFRCRYLVKNKTPDDTIDILKADPVRMGIMNEEGMDKYMEAIGFDTQVRYERNVGDFVVSGRIDYYDPERKLGVELKTPIYVKKDDDESLDQWVNQCKGYLWLQEGSDYPIEKVHLLQMSGTGKKEMVITEGFTSDEIAEFIAEPQTPFRYKECRYCSKKDECPYFGK